MPKLQIIRGCCDYYLGDKMDPLAKGKIVGKCQLCSETWDNSDLNEADETGKCPYCGHILFVREYYPNRDQK